MARRKSSSHQGVRDASRFVGQKIENEPQRRKRHWRRARRRDAQKKIQQRQPDQRGEDERKSESERKAEHQRAALAGHEERAGIGLELHPQGKQGLRGGPVGPMHHQGPAPRPRRSTNRLAMGASRRI